MIVLCLRVPVMDKIRRDGCEFIRVVCPVRRGYKDKVWWVKRCEEREDLRSIEVEKKRGKKVLTLE